MAARKKTRKGNTRPRYDEKTRARAVALLVRRGYSAVATETGVGLGTLRAWATEAGVTPPDGRSSRPPPPASNGSTSNAKRSPVPKTTSTAELELRGLRDFLRAEVRRALPDLVRAEIAAQRRAR